MALADLSARLEQDAQSQVDAITREADARVRAVEAATEAAVNALTSQHLEDERAGRHTAHQRELALARRETRARELEARRALLARVLARARARIPEFVTSAAYAEALPRHLEEALSYVEGLAPRVRCRSALAPLLGGVLERHPDAQLAIDDSVEPGVVVEAADGTVVVENTLAARLARAETQLAIELSRRLDDADR